MSQNDEVKKAVVIYHDNCVDGFASAWAFHVLKEKDYTDGVTYVSINYGDAWTPGDITVDVFILDFSFPRGYLNILASHPCVNKILILDHHKTAKEDLENWPDKPENVEIVFDMERSGCGITWDYFSAGSAKYNLVRPKLISYVEDRDIWKFQLPFSKAINAYIGNISKAFNPYSELHRHLDDPILFDACVEIGINLLVQLNNIHTSIIALTKRKITINGQVGLVCNCNGMFASEVGSILARESGTYGATYYHASDDSVKFSLRSIGDFDVSEIARIFGGGGHRTAAGFELKMKHKELFCGS